MVNATHTVLVGLLAAAVVVITLAAGVWAAERGYLAQGRRPFRRSP